MDDRVRCTLKDWKGGDRGGTEGNHEKPSLFVVRTISCPCA
jgi:hypothetical protein